MPQKKQRIKKQHRTVKFIVLSLCLFLFSSIYLFWWETMTFKTTRYTVATDSLPANFNGFTIVHISDLHNTLFGQKQQHLLKAVSACNPDMIAITGDFIDSYHTDITTAMTFISQAVSIAPVYYVPGNHEARMPQAYAQLKQQMKQNGVIVLEDQHLLFHRDNEAISILGVLDPAFAARETASITHNSLQMTETLTSLTTNTNNYTILLSHRPELFKTYQQAGINLVLSGHTHGGQIRLPFIGAIIAPNQG